MWNDLIEEFTKYVNQKNLPISSEVTHSFFETNSFLLKNRPTLIEYSAFFGSIQIYQYLWLNHVYLSPSLCLHSIHGRNPDLIHLFEEDHVYPPDDSYEICLKESIKCHHNEFASYIIDNLLDQKIEESNQENKFDVNIFSYCFHYYNYSYFPSNLDNKFFLYYLCKYDYLSLIEFLLSTEELDLNKTVVWINENS